MMATHADRFMAAEVPENEMRTFAQRHNLNLFRTENVNVQGMGDILNFFMNTLTSSFLWNRIVSRLC